MEYGMWESVVLRLKAEVGKVLRNHNNGIAIITIHIAADADGNPLFWVVPSGIRVEPSSDAKSSLMKILSSS